MKNDRTLIRCLFALALALPASSGVRAQGYDPPFAFQGVDHTTTASVASRGAGGITIGLSSDPGMLFQNPALLTGIEGIHISIAGMSTTVDASQRQQYSPMKYYANYSLLMEGLTDNIPYHDKPWSTIRITGGVPETTWYQIRDSVQRPFDTIGPNWDRSSRHGLPLQATVVVPFEFAGMKWAAGAGAVEYANLNDFYQNNNVVNPAVGSKRPLPIHLPLSDSVPLPAQWYQYRRARNGSIYGYGGALSAALTPNLSIGVSGMLLDGETDDSEMRLGRGLIMFYTNYFLLSPVSYASSSSGTSRWDGAEWSVSAMYSGKFWRIGGTAMLPSTITRRYTIESRSDSAGNAVHTTLRGKEQMRLPLRGSAGLSIRMRENLTVGLQFTFRSYVDAVYRENDGTESHPWLSATTLQAGGEYRPLDWLTIRGGVREQAEVFEPEGNPLIGEPVRSVTYTAGLGLAYKSMQLNVACEYGKMKYDDIWQTNVNLNDVRTTTVSAELVYVLPAF